MLACPQPKETSVEVQSALIGAFVTVAIMCGMLLRRRRRRVDVYFSIVCVVLGAWFLATFLRENMGPDPWLRVEIAVGSMLPAALVRLFADMMPGSGTAWARRLLAASYPTSALFALLVLSPLGHLPAIQLSAAAYIAMTTILASRLMMQAPEIPTSPVDHARRRYLGIGASLVFLLALAGQGPWAPSGLTASGHLAVMLYVFFLSQIILRDRLLDLNEFLGRMLILAILAVLFATISATLIGLGRNDAGRLFNAVVGVIILLTLYEPLKERLETKVVELFFRERNRLTHVLEDLGTRMQHGVLDPGEMATIVVDTLHAARRATHAAVYLLDPFGHGFVRQAFSGPQPAPRVNANELPALWQVIQQNRSPLLADQLAEEDAHASEPAHRDLIDAMRAVSGDLLIPFVSGHEALGFMALRDDRSVDPYATKEVAQLMKIADTAATVIWNSKLAEKLRERERLAAIGAMAAGLAHEIRNPLGAIKGAAEYLDPREGPPDPELLQVIIDEVNRLNTVVCQFLDYARPFRARFSRIDLNDVVRKTARLIAAQRSELASELELDLDPELPEVEADGEQLKQVILNLVLNAIEASRGVSEPVGISTRFLKTRKMLELRVVDHGEGIPRDDLERIFLPFFTSKQHGTGLGLAVCHRIVMSHGGSIYPESEMGRGTNFVIQLPIDQRRDASSSMMARDPLPRVRRSVPRPAHQTT